jgi:hypothetical protein
MNFAIGNRSYENHNGVLNQEGEISLAGGEERDVFYPIPFASNPNLELSSSFNQCVIAEQKEDHFRVQNKSWHDMEARWHAKGIRIGLLPVPPQPQPTLQLTPPQLPAQPQPITQSGN